MSSKVSAAGAMRFVAAAARDVLGPTAAVLVLCGAAAAEQPVSPESFRLFSEGWTLHFEENGAPYGAETYGTDGTVLWRPRGGPCMPGIVEAEGPNVCFRYDGTRACWRILKDERGLVALPSDADRPRLRVVRRDRARLGCDAPPSV
ncbi:MAG: hypothetical protein ACK4WC_07310 [Rubrimonas sp.]